VSASAVTHTDDITWHHSRFGWSELLARSVLQPIRTGQPVGYRPPGWEFAHLLDAVVWVQSDYAEAERRGIAPERHAWPTAITKSSSRCLLADTTPLAPPAHDAADPLAAGHGAWTCSSADTAGRLAIHIYRWFRVS
jgi:hypothetical protein